MKGVYYESFGDAHKMPKAGILAPYGQRSTCADLQQGFKDFHSKETYEWHYTVYCLYFIAALVTPYVSVYLMNNRRYLIICVIIAIAENSFLFVLLW